MKKIMFNDRYGLTQAVINGNKTMTRRICPDCTPLGNFDETVKHSRYKIGEIVAVAQSYETIANSGYLDIMTTPADNAVGFEIKPEYCGAGWDNKMFVRSDLMPLRIRIKDITVERLQDISEKDCLKEGIKNSFIKSVERYYMYTYPHAKSSYHTPREAFANLIDKVSGKGTWDNNPWVFAYTFELLKPKQLKLF